MFVRSDCKVNAAQQSQTRANLGFYARSLNMCAECYKLKLTLLQELVLNLRKLDGHREIRSSGIRCNAAV